MQQATIAIAGMSCGGCVSAVKKARGAVAGARVDDVTVGSATVSYDASRTDPAALAQTVRDAGYRPLTAELPVAAGATDAAVAAVAETATAAEAAAADQYYGRVVQNHG
ncbi:MAG: heavy-metal-associated domain-containing protein [Gemmatimonadaceae bacterium]